MLYYLPLECYKARYTLSWAAPRTGWVERQLTAKGVPFTRIEPEPDFASREINVGSVVDGVGRSLYAMEQIKALLLLIEAGKIGDNDVIYFDDFWHPGMEALRYAFDLMGVAPRMYAYLFAQSVDEFDFTYPMRHWMRFYEKGNAAILDGIFVCSSILKDLVVGGGICEASKVYLTGFPFSSEEVKERMPAGAPWTYARENLVAFTSRFDKEKNPHFFLDVVERFASLDADVKFVVCTGRKQIKSNDTSAVVRLHKLRAKYPKHLELQENLSKEDYYEILSRSKIQFNTADQDFVSLTVLEATVAGCFPIYPYFRSFPETFEYKKGYMYERLDTDHAVEKIAWILHTSYLWEEDAIKSRNWIYERFDNGMERMLSVMYPENESFGFESLYRSF